MKKPQFITDSIYHLYNRGVEKRDIFLDDKDRIRFIHDLFVLNDEGNVLPANVRLATRKPRIVENSRLIQCLEVRPLNIKKRKLLVEILAFCLMPNHYHLLVRQLQDGGTVQFMRKLGTAYAMYFNLKYDRVGSLFQGRFKAVLVEREAHFLYLPYYIHLNPLDLRMPEWREQMLKSPKRAINFLERYRWSSHLDYAGKKNFPSVISQKFLREFLGSPAEYKRLLSEWLDDISFDEIQDIMLE